MAIVVKHDFFLMKYLVVRCETFCGLKKWHFWWNKISKIIVFETYFIKLLLKYIVLPYEWNIFDKKRSMFESKNECLIKNLKGFDFEIWFWTFKTTFWLKKSFFDKNSFDHNSYDFLSIWHINTTDRRGISLRFFLAYF